MFAAFLALIQKPNLQRFLGPMAKDFIPVFAFLTPIAQWLLFKYSSGHGPTWGPIIIEVHTFFPMLLLSMFSAGDLLQHVDFSNLPPKIAERAPDIIPFLVFLGVDQLVQSSLPPLMGSSIIFTRLGLQILTAVGFGVLCPSIWLIFAIPAILFNVLYNPHFPTDAAMARLNASLQSTHNATILARHESLTGYVSVIDRHDLGYRVMRCDHSLLGGQWLVTPERRSQGQTFPETIYAVFTMLEAVRLIETGDARPDTEKSALVIGLGIGTSPAALINKGIATTTVELDPIVHDYAVTYFGLPTNHTSIISDAVPFVANAASKTPGKYDYIIHDVFTGGAEPAALFTIEFLSGLEKLLSQKGSIAINYAGDLSLPSTQMILNTIHTVFPSCRIFRESARSSSDDTDFINMVVFCTKSAGKKITFKKPTEADFGGSLSRRQHLVPKDELEVKFVFDKGAKVLKRGETQELESHQRRGALSHWHIMRTVLDAGVWENW